MSRAGIEHPDVLDYVTTKDSTCALVLVEDRALADDDALALQAKLKNYLSYALDGQLRKEYPEVEGKELLIRVELSATPSPFIVEFLTRFRVLALASGVNVQCVVNSRNLLSEEPTSGA